VLIAVAAIVVVAVVVLSLLLTGVIPGLGTSSSSKGYTGAGLPYSAARPLADAVAEGAPGGPWTWAGAAAVDVNAVVSNEIALIELGPLAGSGIHYLTSARPEVPVFNGSLASGLSPWWFFEYTNGTTNARDETNLLAVVVVNGTATALATFASPARTGVPPYSPSGAPAMDSPAAMAVAVTSNSSYINAHPRLNVTFGPTYRNATGFEVGWFWDAYFSTCAPFGQMFGAGATQFNGTFYGAEVNDTSGALVSGSGEPQQMTCSSWG
jgi:hypothetical protein